MVRRIFLVALLGCGGGGSAGDASVPDACTMGITLGRSEPGKDAFVAYQDGDEAEISCGFQAILCVLLSIRTEGTQADSGRLSALVEVEKVGAYPANQYVELVSGSDGARYARDLAIPLDGALLEMIGRNATISASLEVKPCSASQARTVMLVDDVDDSSGDGGIARDGGTK